MVKLLLADTLLLAAGAGAVYYILRPQKKTTTTQGLFDFKDISPEGIIEMPDNKYRLVIEVEPINMGLRSLDEQAAIWLGFRNMVNSLSIPTTLLVQTRFLNLKDYLDELERQNLKRPGIINELAKEHIKYLSKKTENKHMRDRRFFIILKVDATDTIESGIQIENQLLNTLLKVIPNPQKQISTAELHTLVRDELIESASIVIGGLDAIGIKAVQLNKKAALEMLYQTFNRDMAPYTRIEEADSMGMFSLFVDSATPDIVLNAHTA